MNTADDLILWGPELMTGIGVIDEQHRVLVDMCNEANKLMQGHVDPEDVKRLVRDLMSYAMYHFEVIRSITHCIVNSIATLPRLWRLCSKN